MSGPRGTLCLFLACWAALSHEVRAQVFVSPGLEAAAGYTSNRFLEPDHRGSPYLRLAPSLTLTALPSGGSEFSLPELSLNVGYHRTDFAESGFEHIEELTAEGSVALPSGSARSALGLSVGTYRDRALPGDDARWAAIAPSFSWTPGRQLHVSLEASATALWYDSRDTLEGDRQEDLRGLLRPGLRWAPSGPVQLWAEAFGDINRSNEDLEEYRAAGGAAGLDATLGPGARGGGWARYQVRTYRTQADGADRRRDTPLSAGIWAAYRLAPGIEVAAEATHLAHRSTDDANDYRVWNVEAGLRLVYDWEVFKP
ncbi:MAG: hypothetical protein AB1578_15585 [Thermodesulfobacteriota bacterium]